MTSVDIGTARKKKISGMGETKNGHEEIDWRSLQVDLRNKK
jgi:hypothetical protein